MAYRKRYAKRGNRRMVKKSGWTWGGAFKSAASIAKTVAPLVAMLNVERKFRDYVITNANINDNYGTPNALYELTNIAEGSAQNQREGISLKCVQVHYDLNIQAHASSNQIGLGVRLLVFRWNDDTAPSITEILEYTDIRSPYNKSTVGKFEVLHDRQLDLVPNQANSKYITADKLTKEVSIHTKYNGNLATDGSFGRIFFVGLSNEPTASGFFPVLNGIIRLDYIDN